MTNDPQDKDVELYSAIMRTYSDTAPSRGTAEGYVVTLAFLRALVGNSRAVNAAAITNTLRTMRRPILLPLGGGLTFRCGSRPVPFLTNVCSGDVLTGTVGADGKVAKYTPLNTRGILVA